MGVKHCDRWPDAGRTGQTYPLSVEDSWEDGDRVVKGASRWVSPQVERVVSALWGVGVYQVRADPLPPTCYPFVIPKSSEKVNQDGAKPPTFRLDFWEDLARALSRIPPREPLFAVHIDLKNPFWSFRLPQPWARRIFYLILGRAICSGGLG